MKFLLNRIRINRRHFRTEQFRTKNEKLKRMLPKEPTSSYKVPVVSLSNTILKNRELQQLQYGLDHCFVDKNKIPNVIQQPVLKQQQKELPQSSKVQKKKIFTSSSVNTLIFFQTIYTGHMIIHTTISSVYQKIQKPLYFQVTKTLVQL